MKLIYNLSISKKTAKMKPSLDQRGMASIIIVSMLVVLLGLLSIGFSRLINRDLFNSLRDQQNKAAYYAAESAINDTIKTLDSSNGTTLCGNKLDQCQSQCQNPLLNQLNQTNGNSTTYNCVLFNPTPQELLYQKLDPSQSTVVKLNPDSGTPFSNFFFFWTRSDGAKPNYISSGSSLLDEGSWISGGYPSLLRVTIYPVPSSGSMADMSDSSKAGFAKTFFLYPGSIGGTNTINYATTADGSLININCGVSSFGGFSYKAPSPAGSYCGSVISNLPNTADNGSYFYARLTPLYVSASAGIQGQVVGSTTDSKFSGDQAVIDVTATSGDIVKRLEARTSLNGSGATTPPEITAIPEYGLQAADTVCKRFVVNGASITVNVVNPGDCSATGGPPPPPPQPNSAPIAVTTAANVLLPYTGVKLNGTVQPNSTTAKYYFQYILNQGGCAPAPGCYPKIPASPASLVINQGTSFQYPVSQTIPKGSLSYGVTYKFRLVATNSSGTGYGSWMNFTTPAPPPPSSSSSSSTSSTSSTSSGDPGSGQGQIGNCSASVAKTGTGAASASYSATGSCPDTANTSWSWSASWGSCDSESGSGSSATVPRYNNTPGSIVFTIKALDGSDKPGSGSAGIDPGGLICP